MVAIVDGTLATGDPQPGSQVQPGQTVTLQTMDNPKGGSNGGWGGLFGGNNG